MWKSLVGALVACLSLLLAACATAPLESQARVQDARHARIYFLRESTFVYAGGAVYLKVNGQEVGNVANGSYFFVDRPPGTYNVTLESPLVPGRFAANLTVRAGGTYYLKIAPRTEHLFIGMAVGVVGQIIEASVVENSGAYSLTAMDTSSGAAMLASLKR